MGAFSFWHVVVLLSVPFSIWGSVRILHKAGRSGWWVITQFIPVVNLVMFWVFATSHWPAVDKTAPWEDAQLRPPGPA